MVDRLPVELDPALLARRGRALHGHVPVRDFHRLAHWLADTAGELRFELDFGRDDHGRPCLRGHARGEVWLECQRCLAAYPLPLDRRFDLVLVVDEAEAAALPEEIDAVVMGESRETRLVDLVEDELILALPLIPRCEVATDCRPGAALLDSDEVLAGEQEPRQQPFADLVRHTGPNGNET